MSWKFLTRKGEAYRLLRSHRCLRSNSGALIRRCIRDQNHRREIWVQQSNGQFERKQMYLSSQPDYDWWRDFIGSVMSQGFVGEIRDFVNEKDIFGADTGTGRPFLEVKCCVCENILVYDRGLYPLFAGNGAGWFCGSCIDWEKRWEEAGPAIALVKALSREVGRARRAKRSERKRA